MNKMWKMTQLSAAADITMGQSPNSSFYNTDERGTPFLQGCAEFGSRYPNTGVHCTPPLRVAKKDSIIISVRAPVGKMNWCDQDYCIGRGLGSISAKKGFANTHFLKHALDQNIHFLHRRSQGSTFLAVGANDLKIFPIPDIPEAMQEKIATVINTIDQTIEKTEALICKYQQIKAGLMHDLFTRGLTAGGKLRPPREQAPELYQETPIGWIPKEWRLAKAMDICYPATKGTTPPYFISSNDEESIPYLRVENLSFNGSLQFDDSSLFVSKIIHNSELARSKVYVGDILMNIVGPPLGKVSMVSDNYEEWNTNQAVAIFRILHKKHKRFLLYYLLSDFAQKWFYIRSKRTSGQVNLTLEMCSNLEIPLPQDDTEILSISNSIAQIFEKITIENDFLVKFKKLKSGLMHDLLTGKVPVTIDPEETTHGE